MTQLAPNRFELSLNGIRHNEFRVTPELGTSLKVMEEPGYWAHVSAKMRMGDEIKVWAEDGSWFAELLVRDAGTMYAKVAVKHLMVFDKESDYVVPAGYEVKWSGPHTKFRVVRGEDVLKDKFVDAAEAKNWLKELLKKVA